MTVTPGLDPAKLSDDDLLRELEHLHATRNETFRHGSDDALAEHTYRTGQLEQEYLGRYPRREVNPQRTRVGARGGSGAGT